MKHIIAVAVAVLSTIPVFAGDGRVQKARKAAPGQYIAVLESDAPGRSEIAAELTRRFGARTRIVFTGFHGFSFESTEAVAEAIARDPRVAWVEENAVGEPAQVANTTTRPFPPGWARDRTNQALPPLDGYGSPGCQGAADIRVYIMDTGINDIDGAEFGSRLRDLYKVDNGGAWSFRDEIPTGHGTSVASVAAGARHGLAGQASVVNVKISNDAYGKTYTDWMIDAISQIDVDHYKQNLNAIYPRGAVVNVSWYLYTGYTEEQRTALDVAVQNSVLGCSGTQKVWHLGFDGVWVERDECVSYKAWPEAYGLTYVVAAGNDGHSVVGSPARLGDDTIGTITVGATMMRDEWMTDWRAVWGTKSSNYGPPVDIWAPGTGVDVYRHVWFGTSITKQIDGSSIASPLVAGQVARIYRSYPSYTTFAVENHLKTDAVSTYPDGSSVIKDVAGAKLLQYAAGRCRASGS